MRYGPLGGVRAVYYLSKVCVLGVYVALAECLMAGQHGNELGRNG
jgi:hypothetical protein